MKTKMFLFGLALAGLAQAQTPAPLIVAPEGSHGMSTGTPNGMRSEAGIELETRAAELGLPQPQTRGEVAWLCGGIGQSEAEYMNRRARDYDLKLTFAGADGAYLADVNVEIRDQQGNAVLQTRCEGPIMLVDLPRNGTYRVQAETQGFEQTRNVRVNKARAQAVVVAWPRSEVAAMQGEPAATGASGTAPGRTMTGPR